MNFFFFSSRFQLSTSSGNMRHTEFLHSLVKKRPRERIQVVFVSQRACLEVQSRGVVHFRGAHSFCSRTLVLHSITFPRGVDVVENSGWQNGENRKKYFSRKKGIFQEKKVFFSSKSTLKIDFSAFKKLLFQPFCNIFSNIASVSSHCSKIPQT